MAPTLASRSLVEQLDSARARTDGLLDLIKPGTLYSRPIPERHRLVFYLGHLEAFDWHLISRKTLDIPSFQREFDDLFEFGIDPPVGKAAEDQPSDWPGEREIRAYNRRVREIIDDVVDGAPDQIVQVAMEHRYMHAETIAYLLHSLPYEQKIANGPGPAHAAQPFRPRMIEIPAGTATLGQKDGEFGWDNEFTEHQVHVPAFAIDKYKVTNGEYVEFVRTGAAAPHFWTRRGDEWFYRGMFAEIPLPLNAPVYATHEEACAYARWAGKELLTEAQFHRAAFGSPSGDERDIGAAHGNVEFAHCDPVDVDATPAGDSAYGMSQLVGNGWEWTSTLFGPFAGFETFPFYPGYSQNFFGEGHYVLKRAPPQPAPRFLPRPS